MVDYRTIRNLDARTLILALERDGFILDRQVGSHKHFRHPDGRRVTVTYHHPGQTLPIKTLKTMVEVQARWTEEDLRRIKIIK